MPPWFLTVGACGLCLMLVDYINLNLDPKPLRYNKSLTRFGAVLFLVGVAGAAL